MNAALPLTVRSVAPSPQGGLTIPERRTEPPRQPDEARARQGADAVAMAARGLVSVSVALVPHALASGGFSAQRLAPTVSQALMTVGATVGAFSHVSALRRRGGDPFGYGTWRALGVQTAVAVPAMGILGARLSGRPAVDFALMQQCLASLVAIAGSGAWLQTVLDRRPSKATDPSRKVTDALLAGGLFTAMICWQAAQLLLAAREGRNPSSNLALGGLTAGGAPLFAAAAGCLGVGVPATCYALQHGREPLRVAGIVVALVAVPLGLLAMARSTP